MTPATILVNGIRLRYDRSGREAAPPVVLLPGLGESRSSWSTVGASLAATHSVYAPDMRGHHDSDWPGAYSFELMRDDVLAFLDVMDLNSVTLIGHSMGGVVTLLAAMSDPSRLARIIVEDAPLPRSDMPAVPLRIRPDGPLPFDWPMIEAIVGQLNAPGADWWTLLPTVRIPAMFIAGGPSSHVSQDLLRETAMTVTDGQLVAIAAGHHIHRDEPDAFLAAVTAFLNGQGRAASS